MKITFKYIFIISSITSLLASCKKDEVFQLSSLNIINATVDLVSTQVNTTGATVNYSTYPLTIAYGASFMTGIPSGTKQISAVVTATPTQSLFSFTEEFKAGELYSLYLAGQMPNVDTVFKKESYPIYSVSDSAIAVRVINLSPTSSPVNITLSGSPSVNEFSNIAYKQQSEFKKYPATSKNTNSSFNFQVRDQAGALLTNYAFTFSNLSGSRFKPVTLVIRGLSGGTGINALGVTFVANY